MNHPIKAAFAAAIFAAAAAGTAFAGPTYTVYATREGLVGGTTANGHVITNNSRFAALPSGKSLTCNGCTGKTVTVRYGNKVVTVPVWDVGPWNTKDDYWNSPRELFQGLPLGKPEAQAAYQDGYNNGKDQFGRTVANPAGIDLSNKVFWTDLGMSNNDWVQVTYNFVPDAPAGTEVIVDNTSSGFSASSNWWTGSSTTGYYGTNYHVRSTQAISDQATWSANLPSSGSYQVYARWTSGSNRASSASYTVTHSGGSQVVAVNQQTNGGAFVYLGTWNFASGNAPRVKLSCWTTSGQYVIADAIRFYKP